MFEILCALCEYPRIFYFYFLLMSDYILIPPDIIHSKLRNLSSATGFSLVFYKLKSLCILSMVPTPYSRQRHL